MPRFARTFSLLRAAAAKVVAEAAAIVKLCDHANGFNEAAADNEHKNNKDADERSG